MSDTTANNTGNSPDAPPPGDSEPDSTIAPLSYAAAIGTAIMTAVGAAVGESDLRDRSYTNAARLENLERTAVLLAEETRQLKQLANKTQTLTRTPTSNRTGRSPHATKLKIGWYTAARMEKADFNLRAEPQSAENEGCDIFTILEYWNKWNR